MIINSISLRNFKSYGNNLQTIHFSNNGELILLRGENANGKSSLLESIDFSIFNIVRGKNIKRVPNYVLPNRFNKNLEVEIDFNNWVGDNIKINRKLSPKGLKITKNDVDITSGFELMTQSEKDNIIGLEYNTYKSLVSLNLADFANFINLDVEIKRNLLNRLFNLDEFDNYLNITRELLKPLYKQREILENKIFSNESVIETYKNNIENLFEQKSRQNFSLIDKNSIKEKMLGLKSIYDNLKKDIEDLELEIRPLNHSLKNNAKVFESQKNKIFEDDFRLNDLYKKIEIFENGNCPLCGTELNTKKHKLEHEKLNEEYKTLEKEILDLKKIHSELRNDVISKNKDRKDLISQIDDKTIELDRLKAEMNNLKNQYQNQKTGTIYISEINKNIDNVEKENDNAKKEIDSLNIKIKKLEKIIGALSERGIRQGMIETIVRPINEHLAKYLIDLESTHTVKLNNQFDASIKDRYEDVHIETLSTGEARKINISIALSYMEMILGMNKKTNILFMDEVFASVDPDNINLMLKVLKKFSTRNKINVIIVNHSNFDMTNFDRVIKIYKEYGFSQIKEEEEIKN